MMDSRRHFGARGGKEPKRNGVVARGHVSWAAAASVSRVAQRCIWGPAELGLGFAGIHQDRRSCHVEDAGLGGKERQSGYHRRPDGGGSGGHPYGASAQCRRNLRQRCVAVPGDVVGPRRGRSRRRQCDGRGDVVMMDELKRDTGIGEGQLQKRYRARDRPECGRKPIPRHRVGQRGRLRSSLVVSREWYSGIP